MNSQPQTPPPAVPLAALKTLIWRVTAPANDPAAASDRYIVAETDPASGATISLLQIAVVQDRYLRIANTDTTLTHIEGFKYLYKRTVKDRGVFSKVRIKEVLQRLDDHRQSVVSSQHLYGLTDAGLVWAPEAARFAPLPLDDAPDAGLLLERLDGDGTKGLPVEVTTFVTPAPVYSKTVVIWARAGRVPRPVFIKQTRSHYSDVAIDVLRRFNDGLLVLKRFEKAVGYESDCLYLDPDGSRP